MNSTGDFRGDETTEIPSIGMGILTKEQRNQLAKVVLEAREIAEAAAKKALHSLGVDEADAPSHLSAENRTLRRALRAQARQLGDKEDSRKKGGYDLYHLTEKIAYDQWHRMLFARFLAENNLLIAPEHGVPVSLQECRELAPELGLRDEWDVAVRFATAILPQIFRADDPAGKIELAPEDRAALRDLVTSLSRDVFRADDSLGWVYQFWQAKRKEEINKSGKKIGADEIASVTQLFTEHYMVKFLLHNTLGAWWVAKRRTEGKDLSLNGIEFTYLRCNADGRPAAGTFSGWPKQAKDLRVLDPCMGSGHFLIMELPMLVAMRMQEEGLSKAEACDAVLRDNLFGLEIDARCTQIAAFNVALAAWKLAGYRQLPPINLACSGLGINARKEEWLKLANGERSLSFGIERLYDLFQKAPDLGSLINPTRITGAGFLVNFHELQPLLETALNREATQGNEILAEMAVTARGLAHAAEILASQFTLIATNVPYLARGKYVDALKEHIELHYRLGKENIATAFVQRCTDFCSQAGTVALVSLQTWLSLTSYKELRKDLLTRFKWEFMAGLGTRAFSTPMWDFHVMLIEITRSAPAAESWFACLDASIADSTEKKALMLRSVETKPVNQALQLNNPEAVISCDSVSGKEILSKYVSFTNGIQTGDRPRFVVCYWETAMRGPEWLPVQSTVDRTTETGGLNFQIRWDSQNQSIPGAHGSVIRGTAAWRKLGVCVSAMGDLPVASYSGELYDENCVVLTPKNPQHLSAIWAYCSSDHFNRDVRAITKALKVRRHLIAVPFDLVRWQKVAAEKYPQGLPKPFSSDPTQWLFNGSPKGSDKPLQVAVARLLGYQWPRQTGSSFPDCAALGRDDLEELADNDGIVCINPIKGEQPAGERLRALLAAAFQNEWTPGKQNELLEQVEFGGKTFDDWLRNGFFEQHCQLFHQRPFIWHIWDGRRDGFSALVNYHKLNRSNLEKLTYTFLGDWIARQKAANDAGEEGSDARLQAAQELKSKLEKIIEGEDPLDIFVRWKPIERQPIGWEPDLNDGVRLNIRPFVIAGVLRKNPNINWNKDRGKDVGSAPWYNKYDLKRVPGYKAGDRINDYHLTLEEKRKARNKA